MREGGGRAGQRNSKVNYIAPDPAQPPSQLLGCFL